jgi:two-component system chemotaxis response regulator CheY
MRILIVDDDFICRQGLKLHLNLLGDIDMVDSGQAAVDAVTTALDQGRAYDLVFLDILMPGMDGQEALRRIRELEAKRGVLGLNGAKVVMTTSVDDRKQVVAAFRSQAEAYLVKPVEAAKLREVLVDLGFIK